MPSEGRKYANGSLSVIFTVRASTASVDLSWRMFEADDLLIAIKRSNDHFTAFASSGEPSANLSPSRNLNVYVNPSGDSVHDSAASGMTSSGAPGLGMPGFNSTSLS